MGRPARRGLHSGYTSAKGGLCFQTFADTWLSSVLAFVGGYGDADSFVLAKTFTGHVTGSLVLAAIADGGDISGGAFVHTLVE